MTQVGHALAGAGIAVLCLPRQASLKRAIVQIGLFSILALVPDLSFSGWGHDRYYFSHSLFVNLAILLGLAALFALWQRLKHGPGAWTIAGGAAAWLSHLLLDSFYNHGYGIAIFWPVSEARLILPIPWLAVLYHQLPLGNPEAMRVYSLEMLTFIPFVLLALIIRRDFVAGVFNRKLAW